MAVGGPRFEWRKQDVQQKGGKLGVDWRGVEGLLPQRESVERCAWLELRTGANHKKRRTGFSWRGTVPAYDEACQSMQTTVKDALPGENEWRDVKDSWIFDCQEIKRAGSYYRVSNLGRVSVWKFFACKNS